MILYFVQKQSSGGVLTPVIFIKKGIWQRCFPVNFAKFLRTNFFTEHLQWLLVCVILWQDIVTLIELHAYNLKLYSVKDVKLRLHLLLY